MKSEYDLYINSYRFSASEAQVLQVRLHVLRILTVTDTNTERPEFICYTNLGESKSPKKTEDFFFAASKFKILSIYCVVRIWTAVRPVKHIVLVFAPNRQRVQ